MAGAPKKDRRVTIYLWIVLQSLVAFLLAGLVMPEVWSVKIALGMIAALALVGIAFGIVGGFRLAKEIREANPR